MDDRRPGAGPPAGGRPAPTLGARVVDDSADRPPLALGAALLGGLGTAWRSARLARWLGQMPRTLSCDVPGLGTLTANLENVAPAPDRRDAGPVASRAAFLVRTAAHQGAALLEVDQALALSLVRGALGAPAALLPRPLGPTERGVLGAVLSRLLGALDRPIWIDLGTPDRPEDPVTLALTLRCSSGATGPIALSVPGAWLPTAPPLADADAAATLEARVSLIGATTTIPAAEWASLAVGDAVVYDGVAPLDPAHDWSVELWLPGARHASGCATWKPNGDLRGDTFFLPPTSASGSVAAHPFDGGATAGGSLTSEVTRADRGLRKPQSPGGPAPSDLPDRLDGMARSAALLGVEVRVEVAQAQLTVDDLAGLASGGVISLGARSPRRVTLLVGGRPVGEGELAVVEAQLAVRVAQLYTTPR